MRSKELYKYNINDKYEIKYKTKHKFINMLKSKIQKFAKIVIIPNNILSMKKAE